jgi:hypothetical protein
LTNRGDKCSDPCGAELRTQSCGPGIGVHRAALGDPETPPSTPSTITIGVEHDVADTDDLDEHVLDVTAVDPHANHALDGARRW